MYLRMPAKATSATVTAVLDDSLPRLRRLLRAFNAETNSTVAVLFAAARRRDRVVGEAARVHLANILGLAFVSAQTLLTEARNRGQSLGTGAVRNHAWLTDVELLNACANFWKHQAEWKDHDWNIVEGPPRSRLERNAAKSARRTAMEVAGLGLTRDIGVENLFILANVASFDEANWAWLVDPIKAWYVPRR
jgi:hypothetical protein